MRSIVEPMRLVTLTLPPRQVATSLEAISDKSSQRNAKVQFAGLEDAFEHTTNTQAPSGYEVIPKPDELSRAAKIAKTNQASGLSDEDKLRNAIDNALRFFSRLTADPNHMLELIRQELEPLGVVILTGRQARWVNSFLGEMGTLAAFYPPESINYGGQVLRDSELVGLEEQEEELPPEAEDFFDELERKGQYAILVSSQQEVNPNTLFHELFHFYQTMAGLTIGPIDARIGSVYRSSNAYFEMINMSGRFAVLRDPSRAFTGRKPAPLTRFFPELKNANSKIESEAGKCLRARVAREMETSQFLIDHQCELGLTDRDGIFNQGHLASHRVVNELSWLLDIEDQQRGNKSGKNKGTGLRLPGL